MATADVSGEVGIPTSMSRKISGRVSCGADTIVHTSGHVRIKKLNYGCTSRVRFGVGSAWPNRHRLYLNRVTLSTTL